MLLLVLGGKLLLMASSDTCGCCSVSMQVPDGAEGWSSWHMSAKSRAWSAACCTSLPLLLVLSLQIFSSPVLPLLLSVEPGLPLLPLLLLLPPAVLPPLPAASAAVGAGWKSWYSQWAHAICPMLCACCRLMVMDVRCCCASSWAVQGCSCCCRWRSLVQLVKMLQTEGWHRGGRGSLSLSKTAKNVYYAHHVAAQTADQLLLAGSTADRWRPTHLSDSRSSETL